jgi:hypothetical protein
MTTNQLPPAAALLVHTVKDFDRWKQAFDDHQPAREAAGILGHHINRSEDDPNVISIYLAVSDLEQARAFSETDDLRRTMETAGVVGPPQVSWMTPVREQIVWEGEHPACLVKHRVDDFDRWLKEYDAVDEMRRAKGIIGHAANRSRDDESMAIVYHQADAFSTLRTFLGSSDLANAMEDGGVISEPEITFHTGGWAARYG